MYTVLRFSAVDGDDVSAQRVRELVVEACSPGKCGRVRNSAFACDVSDSDCWDTQLSCMETLLRAFGPVLQEIAEQEPEVDVSLDVAIEPEDRGDRPYLPIGFPSPFLEELARLGIQLDVTSYV